MAISNRQPGSIRMVHLVVMLGWLLAAAVTSAAESVDGHLLRLETGMHTAPIWRASTDALGSVLATASDDKTVRIWNIKTQVLMQTLRPPIDNNDLARLYAVALSPDGELVAAAGSLGANPDRTYSIYIFERRAGTVIRRIPGLGNAVLDLTWSKDGRYLAAALCGGHGIDVFRTSDFVRISRDDPVERTVGAERQPSVWCPGRIVGSGHDSMGLDFDQANRLVVTGYDATIRLYQVSDKGVQWLRTRKWAQGTRPFAARFSPDPKNPSVAVGFDYSTQVEVLDARCLETKDPHCLETRIQPRSDDVNGALLAVAWSSDGKRLYAGGFHYSQKLKAWAVREWDSGGQGVPRDLKASMYPIQDLRITPLGPLFVSQRPEWGVIGAAEEPVVAQTADFWWACGDFAVSPNGSTVRFPIDAQRKEHITFDAARNSLVKGDIGEPLYTADTASSGLEVQFANEAPAAINGHKLLFDAHEFPLCGAVSADGTEAYIGTNWNIRVFDSRASFGRPFTAPAWRAFAVVPSRDGRLVVGAFGDGTIRWYRRSDGQELLALFVHPDRKRWVLWTPSGYFDASPGAEGLVGWQVHRGADQTSDFFPVAVLRDRYYRPDVVARVLHAADEKLALQQADERRPAPAPAASRDLRDLLPPVVRITAPEDGTVATADRRTRLRVVLRSPSGKPISEVRVRVNTRPLDPAGVTFGPSRILTPPAPGESAEEREIALDLSQFAGQKEVSIEVDARSGERPSNSARLALTIEAPTLGSKARRKPNLYGVIVGVSTYEKARPPLHGAEDARKVLDALRLQEGEGGLYGKFEPRILDESRVSKSSIEAALKWLRESTTRDDIAIVFLAGHGVNTVNYEYFFLPSGADPNAPEGLGIRGADLIKALSEVPGRVLVFLDTCYGGAVFSNVGATVSPETNFMNEMLALNSGIAAYAASTGNTRAQELNRDGGVGAFTYALLSALRGELPGAGDNRQIKTLELGNLIMNEVSLQTGGKQVADYIAPHGMPNFPLFLIRP